MKDIGNAMGDIIKLNNRLDSSEFHLMQRQELMGSLKEYVKRRKKLLIKYLGELEEWLKKLNEEKQGAGQQS